AENTILSGLLEAAPHDHTAQLGRHRDAPRPRHLRLAESYVEAHLGRPLTIEDMATAAGVSARALQRPSATIAAPRRWPSGATAASPAPMTTCCPGAEA